MFNVIIGQQMLLKSKWANIEKTQYALKSYKTVSITEFVSVARSAVECRLLFSEIER